MPPVIQAVVSVSPPSDIDVPTASSKSTESMKARIACYSVYHRILFSLTFYPFIFVIDIFLIDITLILLIDKDSDICLHNIIFSKKT